MLVLILGNIVFDMRTYNFGIIGPGSHYKKNIEPVLVKNKKINIIKFLEKNKD